MTAPAQKPPIVVSAEDQALIDAATPLAEAGVEMGASRERAVLSRAFMALKKANAELRLRLAELGGLVEDLYREKEGKAPKVKRKVIGGG